MSDDRSTSALGSEAHLNEENEDVEKPIETAETSGEEESTESSAKPTLEQRKAKMEELRKRMVSLVTFSTWREPNEDIENISSSESCICG